MAKTELTIRFQIPTTSMSRVQDVMVDLKKVIDDHRGEKFFTTISGPIPGTTEEAKTNGTDTQERTEDDSTAERGRVGGRTGRSDDAGSEDAGSDDKPKRGRGRPRKSDAGSTEAPGTSSGKRQRDDEDGGGSEGVDGDEPKRTRKGSDEGSGQGEGRSGGSGRGGSSERGNREEARLNDEDDDWGDEDGGEDFSEDDPEEIAAKSSKPWPDSLTPDDSEIDKAYVSKLLGDHYNATGGKDRTLTFDLMEDVTKTRKLGEIDEEDYRPLVKALLKDIARYKYGIKKAK